MKLYLTRHGQTDWNLQDKVQGKTDIPLNETGIRQAHMLSEALADTPIDLALTSPLRRAYETCAIVCEAHGIPYETCPELIEQNFGIFEGINRFDPDYLAEKGRFFARFPEGESFLDVAGRIYPFLERCIAGYPDRNVLIVAHNGICRIIHSYFCDMSDTDFLNFQLRNCEVREYDCRSAGKL